MNSEFMEWLEDFSRALQADDCMKVKDVILRNPAARTLETKEEFIDGLRGIIGRGHATFNDRCIPLEPRI